MLVLRLTVQVGYIRAVLYRTKRHKIYILEKIQILNMSTIK